MRVKGALFGVKVQRCFVVSCKALLYGDYDGWSFDNHVSEVEGADMHHMEL